MKLARPDRLSLLEEWRLTHQSVMGVSCKYNLYTRMLTDARPCPRG